MSPTVLVHLLNKVPQHLFCDIEVSDQAVLEGADRGDGAGRAAEHAFRFDPDGVDFARAAVDRDHAGLRENDAATAHVDERVGGPEIDSHITATEPGEIGEEAHASAGWTSFTKGRPSRSVSLPKRRCAEIAANPLSAWRRQKLSPQVQQASQRKPDDVEVVAIDRVHEDGARSLDRVAAGA